MLKSDQNGIEMLQHSCLGAWRAELKSDQNGIEIGKRRLKETCTEKVKIRPKWD